MHIPSSQLFTNKQVVMAAYPEGEPEDKDFRIQEVSIPSLPEPNHVLLKTIYLSLDPYMRGRMSTAPSYVKGLEVSGLISSWAI